jgi:hypothetical protein
MNWLWRYFGHNASLANAGDSYPSRCITREEIAKTFEPYLEAALTGSLTGEAEFDEDVTGVRGLSLFLAERVVKLLSGA